MWLRFNKILNLQWLFVIIFLAEYTSTMEYFTEKPDWIKPCKIYQPGFTKCSTESIDKLMKYITHEGIPELKEKVGALDPLKLDQIIFKGDNNQAVTLTANLTDVILTGFANMVIKESKVSKKDFSWLTKIYLPKARLDGKYKMAGKILLIPLNGSGKIFIEMEDVDIIAFTKTRLYEKDLKIDLKISKLHTHLDNIFNGNSKEVEESTNQFFNDNWQDFFEALRPMITETIEGILLEIMKDMFDLIPANFIVEDIPKSTELYKEKS